MWSCDSCRNVNADDAAYCFQCGDLGPLGEEMRLKAQRRPGEQLVWLIAMATMFIWPLAILLPKVFRHMEAAQHPPPPVPGHAKTVPDPDVGYGLTLVIVIALGVLAVVYLVWVGIWISNRRREHKALVDTDE